MKIISVINNFSSSGSEPRWYIKADTTLLRNNDAFYLPGNMGRISAEPQIVVRISRLAKCIDERFASRCCDAAHVAVNFTAEDVLDALRAEGLPWEAAVGFDHSTAISNDTVGIDCLAGGAQFFVDGTERLRLDPGQMRFSIDHIISRLSHAMTLRIGDLILLGAPARFDAAVGDNYRLSMGGRTLLDFDIK